MLRLRACVHACVRACSRAWCCGLRRATKAAVQRSTAEAGYALALLGAGVAVRMLVALGVSSPVATGRPLAAMEQAFLAVAWLPKATVQAALAGASFGWMSSLLPPFLPPSSHATRSVALSVCCWRPGAAVLCHPRGSREDARVRAPVTRLVVQLPARPRRRLPRRPAPARCLARCLHPSGAACPLALATSPLAPQPRPAYSPPLACFGVFPRHSRLGLVLLASEEEGERREHAQHGRMRA